MSHKDKLSVCKEAHDSSTVVQPLSLQPATKTKGLQICSRCIMDTTVPSIRFDTDGVCNFCKLHDKLDKLYPLNEEGERQLHKIVERIKRSARGRKYDCVVGVSGGRDTSYCLYMTKKLGLRPLAVHFDNGWDSEVAKNNLRKVLSKLDVDLHTVVMDWEESRELTNANIRASVPYIDLFDDIGIASALYRTAACEGIRYIIHSHSFRCEGINPLLWNYFDGRFARRIIRRFCRFPLKHFQNVELHHMLYWLLVKRIRVFTMTNYYRDMGQEIDEFLSREFGWEDTGGWHYDNELFGLQCYYARHKFGIDWRIVEYSAWVRTGTMTREQALEKMKEIPPIEVKEVVDYCLKKQGISQEEWQEIMAAEPKYFTDYPTWYPLLKMLRLPIRILGRLHIIPAHTYEKLFET